MQICVNQRSVYFSVKSNRPSCFQAIARVGNDTKARNFGSWVEDKNSRVLFFRPWTNMCSKHLKRKIFFIVLWMMMKNGFNVNNWSNLKKTWEQLMFLYRQLYWIFTIRLCCVFGGNNCLLWAFGTKWKYHWGIE